MAVVTSFDLDDTNSGLNGAISYTEGSSSILLAQNAAVAATGNFASQTLTIFGLLPDDHIAFAGGVTIVGNSILVAGTSIGTFTGGIGGAEFVVTFNSNASASEAQTLLRNLTYSSTHDNPTSSHSLSIDLAGTTRTDKLKTTPVNDAPVLDLNGAGAGTSAALVYNPGDPLTKIAPAGTLFDADSANFKDGSLRVGFLGTGTPTDRLGIVTDATVTLTGSTLRINGLTIGTVSGGTNGADLVVTFTNGNSTPAAVQTLLEHIGYASTSAAPSLLPRTVTFTLNDGDGVANGGDDAGSATAMVRLPNVPPVLDLDSDDSTAPGTGYATTAFFNHGGATLADMDVNITDADDVYIESMTFTLVDGAAGGGADGDEIGILDLDALAALGITVIAAPFHSLTLSGSAPAANYEAAFQYVAFVANNNDLSLSLADRHVMVTVNDGSGDSNTAITTIHVALPVPIFDLDADDSTAAGTGYDTTFVQLGAPVAIADSDVTIITNTGNIVGARIEVLGAQPGDVLEYDVFALVELGIIPQRNPSNPASIGLSGSASAENYEAALQLITFASSSPSTADRTIDIVIADGTSGTRAFTTVHVAPPPDVPLVLDLDADDSTAPGTGYATTFFLDRAFVPVAGSDVLITDPDDANIESVTFTLIDGAPGVYGESGDFLVLEDFAPLTALGLSLTAGGNNFFTLSGSVPAANYQAALQYIKFAAFGSNANLTDRHVTIVVNDGTNDSNTATATIHVAIPPPNVPPVLDLDADDSTAPGADYATSFVLNGAPVALAGGDVTITDTDDVNMESVTFTLIDGELGDALLIEDFAALTALGLSLTGSGPDYLILSGAAPAANYQAALQYVKFASLGSGSSLTDRHVSIFVNDGTDGSNAATATIHVVTPPSVPPVLDLDADDSTAPGADYATTFVLSNAPVALADNDVSITDADDTDMESVTFTLVDGETGDMLLFQDFGALTSLGLSLTAASPGSITFSGSVPAANYAAALQFVMFATDAENPTFADRHVSVVVNDGTGDSNSATATVHLASGTPVLDLDADDSTAPGADYATTAFLNFPATPVAGTDVSIADIDDVNLESVTFTLVDGADSDQLTILDGNALAALGLSWSTGFHTVTLSGSVPTANYEAALQYVGFAAGYAFDLNPNLADRHVMVTVNDGSSDSNTAMTTINVDLESPVLDLDADDSTVEGSSYDTTFVQSGAPVAVVDSDVAVFTNNDIVAFAHIGVSGAEPGDVLLYDEFALFELGIFVFDVSPTSIFLDGSASTAAYEAALQLVTFSSTSESTADREISITVGDLVSQGTAFATVHVAPSAPGSPVLDLDADDLTAPGVDHATTFVINSAPVALAGNDVSIIDADDVNLESVTFTLLDGQADDYLLIDDFAPLFALGLDMTAAGPNYLTLSGSVPLENYQAALQYVKFAAYNFAPSTEDRHVAVVVNDGTYGSNTAITTVHVTEGTESLFSGGGVNGEDLASLALKAALDVLYV